MSLGRLTQQAKQCLEKRSQLSVLNAFVPATTSNESILRNSQISDERQAKGKISCSVYPKPYNYLGQPLSAIDGQLIAIKDNICTSNEPTTCASAFLHGFRSPFPATVIEKLKASGAIIAGKTNLDEFGMG